MAHILLRAVSVTLWVWGEISGDLVYGKQLFLPGLPLPPKLLENPIGGLSLSLALFQTRLGKVELEKVEPALVLFYLQRKLEEQIEDLFKFHFSGTRQSPLLFSPAKSETRRRRARLPQNRVSWPRGSKMSRCFTGNKRQHNVLHLHRTSWDTDMNPLTESFSAAGALSSFRNCEILPSRCSITARSGAEKVVNRDRQGCQPCNSHELPPTLCSHYHREL